MFWSAYLAFLGFAILVILIPGPDFTIVVKNTLMSGQRRGLASAAGISSSCLIQGAAAVAGLGTLIVHAEPVFEAIKWAGVAYLAFLGIQALRSVRGGATEGLQTAITPVSTFYGGWRQGFLSNITNPKVLIFYVAILPQFLKPGMGGFWLVAFAVSHALLGFFYLLLLAVVLHRIRKWFLLRRVRQVIAAVSGVVLLGFSVGLAVDNAR